MAFAEGLFHAAHEEVPYEHAPSPIVTLSGNRGIEGQHIWRLTDRRTADDPHARQVERQQGCIPIARDERPATERVDKQPVVVIAAR
jgi:hypothetical protein